MSARITYYLGAGASYHSIPTVKDMPVRIKVFLEMVKSLGEPPQCLQYEAKLKIYASLIDEIRKYGTPDTLAKNFYLTKNKSLSDLKKLLSCYLVFEQLEKSFDQVEQHIETALESKGCGPKNDQEITKKEIIDSLVNPVDRRYTSLFATILDREKNMLKIPQNVNFISWNYDSQLERSFQDFCEIDVPISDVQGRLNVLPRINTQSENDSVKKDELNIVKLNGTGGFSMQNPLELFDFYKQRLCDKSWKKIIDLMFYNNLETTNRLHFAWEGEDHNYPSLKRARLNAPRIMQESDVIVVIGYSFPDFNRRIDKVIFSWFKGKMFIQDPDAENIVQKIRGVNPKIRMADIETMTNTDNFFIPYEFWEE